MDVLERGIVLESEIEDCFGMVTVAGVVFSVHTTQAGR